MILRFLVGFLVNGVALSLLGQSFPVGWQGLWKGELQIWNGPQQVDAVPMSLAIQPADTAWTFVITYRAGLPDPDVRDYSLIAIDPEAGHYAIDEHNGIILDAYLIDHCLYDRFAGMGSDLLARICLEGEALEYEIVSGQADPVRISGDTIMGSDTIPAISSYYLYNVIKARLRRAE